MSNVGLRIFSNISRPPKALIEGFSGIPVANIADNMKNEIAMRWLIDSSIAPDIFSPIQKNACRYTKDSTNSILECYLLSLLSN